MKALVFGATGQVGAAFIRQVPSNWTIAALSHADCDVTNEAKVHRVMERARPDVVLNAAAYVAVDKAEAEPEAALSVNGDAPGYIAAAARRCGAKMVHISTDFVFDGRASRPYLTTDETHPLSVYGRTKLAGERNVIQEDPNALIVRTAWIYAARGRNFVHTMLALLSHRERVSVVADQIGTPTSASSLAAALVALTEIDATGTFHFTDAGTASWYDFAVAIAMEARALNMGATATVVPIATRDFPTPAQRPSYSVLDKSETWALMRSDPHHWRIPLRSCMKEIKENG